MFVAFIVSSYVSKNIFIADSPRPNPYYLANLRLQFDKTINNISLAFASFMEGRAKKDIASNSDKEDSVSINSDGSISIKRKEEDSGSSSIAVTPTSVPSSLFKSISKSVSAYEGDDKLIFRFEKNAKVKIGEIEVNGQKYQIIDLTTK